MVPTVLLVEDDADHAELFRRAFERHPSGFRLVIAASLSEARGALLKQRPTLIVTDLVLPDGAGSEILADAHQQGIPVVILTSRGDEEAAVRALKLGAIDYVVKPADTFEDLPHVVERALREWHQREACQQLERQLADFFELSLSLICILDSEHRFQRVNPAVPRTLGWTEEELRQTPLLLLVHPDDRPAAELWLRGRAAAGGPVEWLMRFRCRDESYRWLQWTAAPGTKQTLFATAMDVTDRIERSRVQRLREISQAKLSVLTPRERQVLKRVVDGLPNKAIAAELELNDKTVEKHRSRLMRKLKCRNLPSLVKLVMTATATDGESTAVHP